jgi:hypothetical protein
VGPGFLENWIIHNLHCVPKHELGFRLHGYKFCDLQGEAAVRKSLTVP